MATGRQRWQGLSAETKRLLKLAPGEATLLDFKTDAQALTDEYMALMANAAALADEDLAVVLLGVAERKHPTTKQIYGEVVGLTGDLHRLGETIASRSAQIGPTPVDVRVFEENVSDKPILRVELRPTLPPHYDQRGRRATRQHTTSRAMTDEELLTLLERRMEHRYGGVAERTADLMMGDFRVVNDDVLESLETLEQSNAEGHAGMDVLNDRIGEVYDRLEDIAQAIDAVPDAVLDGEPDSMERALSEVQRVRTMAGAGLTLFAEQLDDDLIARFDSVMNSSYDVLTYERNHRMFVAWSELLEAIHAGGEIRSLVRAVVEAHERAARSEKPFSLIELRTQMLDATKVD